MFILPRRETNMAQQTSFFRIKNFSLSNQECGWNRLRLKRTFNWSHTECTFYSAQFIFFNEARILLVDKFSSLQYFMTTTTPTSSSTRVAREEKNSSAGGKKANADVCNNGILMYVGTQNTKSNEVPILPRNRKCIIVATRFIKNVQAPRGDR